MASKEYSESFFKKIKELFGKYIISKNDLQESWIGLEKSGNFAKVTKGTFRGKSVALKKVTLTKNSVKLIMIEENELSSILRELSILIKIKSNNIPRLEGIYLSEERLEIYFLLDFIDGSTLKELFSSNFTWNNQQKLLIAYRIVKILVYITSQGVIHRDIKPENIMIDKDSNLEPFLIDFGFSKIKQSDKLYTLTSSRCTPLYSPPENIFPEDEYASQIGSTVDSLQMKIDEQSLLTKISYKVDVWSFGCVLYELFTGKMPWMHLFPNSNVALKVVDIFDKLQNNHKLYSNEDEKNYPNIIYIVDHCTKSNVNQRWDIHRVFKEIESLIIKQRSYIKEEIDNIIYEGEVIRVNLGNTGKNETLYDGTGKLITDNDDEELKVIYCGGFEYGNKANFGVEKGPNYEYYGNWRNHQKHGYGYFKINEYDQNYYYQGSFRKDKKDGYGYFIIEGECVCQGQFSEDSLINGIKYDLREKKIYKGRFDEGLFKFGEVSFLATGEKYHGEYYGNKRHGYGYMVNKKGEVTNKGYWNNDILTKVIKQNKA